MCSPVNHADFPLPLQSFIARIERDLAVQADLAEHPPGWVAPSFKPKPAGWTGWGQAAGSPSM